MAAAQPPDLTLEQVCLLTEWRIESGIDIVAKNTDQTLTARIKRWWYKEEPAPDDSPDGDISDEKLENIRKSVDALLN